MIHGMKKMFLFFANKLQKLVRGRKFLNDNEAVLPNEEGCQGAGSSGVLSESIAALAKEIIQLLEVQQIYKFPQLDLKSLSERLKTPAYLVTRAINEGLGVNFCDLINLYRVEEVKSLLKSHDCKRFTLLAVAFDAGFSSKTTFNTVFKKVTGLTPSSYRDQHCVETDMPRIDHSHGIIKRFETVKVRQLAN